MGGGEAEVDFDQRRPGKISGVERHADAVVTGPFAGGVETEVSAAANCKLYSRKVDVEFASTNRC